MRVCVVCLCVCGVCVCVCRVCVCGVWVYVCVCGVCLCVCGLVCVCVYEIHIKRTISYLLMFSSKNIIFF